MRHWVCVLLFAVLVVSTLVSGCQESQPPCDVAERAVPVEPVEGDETAEVEVAGTWNWNRYRYAGGGHHGTWTLTLTGDEIAGTFDCLCHEESGPVKGYLQGNQIVLNDGQVRFMGTVAPSSMTGTWVHKDDLTASPQDWDAVAAPNGSS